MLHSPVTFFWNFITAMVVWICVMFCVLCVVQSSNIFLEISLRQWLCVRVLSFVRCALCSRVTCFWKFRYGNGCVCSCCVLHDISSHCIPLHSIARQCFALHCRAVQFIALHWMIIPGQSTASVGYNTLHLYRSGRNHNALQEKVNSCNNNTSHTWQRNHHADFYLKAR